MVWQVVVCYENVHNYRATFWNNCMIYSGKYEYNIMKMSIGEQEVDHEIYAILHWVGVHSLVDGKLLKKLS